MNLLRVIHIKIPCPFFSASNLVCLPVQLNSIVMTAHDYTLSSITFAHVFSGDIYPLPVNVETALNFIQLIILSYFSMLSLCSFQYSVTSHGDISLPLLVNLHV